MLLLLLKEHPPQTLILLYKIAPLALQPIHDLCPGIALARFQAWRGAVCAVALRAMQAGGEQHGRH